VQPLTAPVQQSVPYNLANLYNVEGTTQLLLSTEYCGLSNSASEPTILDSWELLTMDQSPPRTLITNWPQPTAPPEVNVANSKTPTHQTHLPFPQGPPFLTETNNAHPIGCIPGTSQQYI